MPVANAAEQPDENFPLFELCNFDSLTGGPSNIRSQRGIVLIRLPNGSPFRGLSLRIVSARIPLKLKYRCLYKPIGGGADMLNEAAEGKRCPVEDAAYIKQVTFESKIYYRCWLSREGHPQSYDPHPGGALWCYNGKPCGTTEDGRWITALEIKMPPLVEGWRAA
jgi:hypothetical protein